jgi:hypothetical protein
MISRRSEPELNGCVETRPMIIDWGESKVIMGDAEDDAGPPV